MKRYASYLTFALLAGWTGCVDKVELTVDPVELPIIVDGLVSTYPGPDTVELTLAYPADGKGHPRTGIEGARMAITEDTGLTDSLTDIGNGYYVTNLLDGDVGRIYQLTIRLKDTVNGGYTYVSSTPQRLLSAGTIDSIYYEFATGTDPDTDLPSNGFNIFLDASVSPSSNRRMLWRFFGTYKTTTDPSQIMITIPCTDPVCPTMPLPCAETCECCTCWYNTYEQAPIVSNPVITGGEQLNHVSIQYIPINSNTFFEKYRVQISQMELSEEVFEFYKAIRRQADNASSIFQPPFFELKGNLSVQSGNIPVIGTFAASAIVKKHIYIPRSAVPFALPTQLQAADCRVIAPHSTNVQPPFWE